MAEERKLRILYVEDEDKDAALVAHALREGGFDFTLTRVETQDSFLTALKQNPPSVILSDHGLPAFDGFRALELARETVPDVPFIFLTGSLGEEMTIQALKSGATDFVLKHRLNALVPAVHRALRLAEYRYQRRQAEEALLSSEERYRSLVELSPDALFVVIEERLVFINSAGVRLIGAANPERLLGGAFLDLVHPDYRASVMEQLRQVRQTGRAAAFRQQKLSTVDGGTVAVELAAAPLIFAGKAAAQAIAHDITERNQAEEQIRSLNADLEKRVQERTLELEATNRELEAFSYSVSHDLRAPLRHIEGFVDILLSAESGPLSEESRRHLQTISQAARQMSQLIDDLLAFSRTARAELRRSPLELSKLVQAVIRDLLPETENRQIEWVIQNLPQVEADPSLLRQVLLNLISNALKYTRTRPIARIEILAQPSDTEHIIVVRDNGVGFDMRYAHKLFGVFQRLHRAADFEGTGIGLANVRRIIHRHGGRTWAEGQLNQGAAFYFSLPKS